MATQTKIFKSRFMNLLGLQIARILIARTLLVARRTIFNQVRDDATLALLRDGYVVIPDFLGEDDFNRVRQEFLIGTSKAEFVTKRVVDTAGLVRISCTVSSANRRVFERTVRCLLGSERVERILAAYDGRRSLRSVGSTFQLSFWRTQLHDKGSSGFEQADHTNTVLHSDSFQSVVKFFFYLNDVAEEDGPHAYVPRSHRLSFWRLGFEYFNSITSMRDSPRLGRTGLWKSRTAPVKHCYPANTLIVADTFGFHQAVLPQPGRGRNIVYLQYRSPPFR